MDIQYQFHVRTSMKFHQELAIALLKMIEAVPPEVFLQSPDQFPLEQIIAPLREGLATSTDPATALLHLHVLSHSGLIFPQSNLVDLHDLAAKIDRKNLPVFWFQTLPQHLRHYLLTMQGYEYLEVQKNNLSEG